MTKYPIFSSSFSQEHGQASSDSNLELWKVNKFFLIILAKNVWQNKIKAFGLAVLSHSWCTFEVQLKSLKEPQTLLSQPKSGWFKSFGACSDLDLIF